MELAKTIKLATLGFKPADIKKVSESGINSDDLIKLAENGYSVADVDELITLTQQEPEKTTPENNPDSNTVPDESTVKTSDDASIKYKEELDASAAKIKELESKIKAIQNENAGKALNSTPAKTPREQVQEIFKQIY